MHRIPVAPPGPRASFLGWMLQLEAKVKTPTVRIVFSFVVLGIYWLFRALYSPFENLIRQQAGLGQFSNDPVQVGLSLVFSQHNMVVEIAAWVVFIVLVIVWLPWVAKALANSKSDMALWFLLTIGATVALTTACGPYKGTTVVQVSPNQTAFLLPSQGDTTQQVKFNSIEFLRSRKQVAAKIIEISYRQHQVGRMNWEYDFVPNQILILVDRKPVSRQWTFSKETGTANKNEAIALESQESIGFHHGVVVNAVIEEDDTETFLYYYGGAGKLADASKTGVLLTVGLDEVMDQFVRTWVANKLYAEFKALPLSEGQIKAAEIFKNVEIEAKANFKLYGITILDMGGVEGLVYDNAKVQESIDQKFQAAAQATAQAINNTKDIEQANARATITTRDVTAQTQAYGISGQQLGQFIVNKSLADKSKGEVPQVLVVTGDGTQTMPFPFPFFFNPNQITPTATPSSTR